MKSRVELEAIHDAANAVLVKEGVNQYKIANPIEAWNIIHNFLCWILEHDAPEAEAVAYNIANLRRELDEHAKRN
jgi:hypothetical protein